MRLFTSILFLNILTQKSYLSYISFVNQLFIANVYLDVRHKDLHFFHGSSCSCDVLKFIFNIYVTLFFQRFHVNILQHVFWAYFHFTCLCIVHFHSVEDFFLLLLSHYLLIFHIISSYLCLSYQHQCIACNFQPKKKKEKTKKNMTG